MRAYYRQAATDEWTFLGEDRVALTGAYEAGLAVSSHVDGTLARATFDNVSVVPHFGLFSGQVDIGRVGVLGGDAANDIERMLWGSGADIWGTADAFHYNYGAISPTGVISAQVRSIQNTHRWAKAGVMIRSDLTPGSPHVMLIVSAAMGVAMQYRAVPSGISASVRNEPGVAPKWVRLRRRGNTILGEVSDDGVTWNFFGAIDLPLGDVVTAGLAVTSHHNGKWAKGVFQDVLLLR